MQARRCDTFLLIFRMVGETEAILVRPASIITCVFFVALPPTPVPSATSRELELSPCVNARTTMTALLDLFVTYPCLCQQRPRGSSSSPPRGAHAARLTERWKAVADGDDPELQRERLDRWYICCRNLLPWRLNIYLQHEESTPWIIGNNHRNSLWC